MDNKNLQFLLFFIEITVPIYGHCLRAADHVTADSFFILKRLQEAVHVLGLLEKNGNLIIPVTIECRERSIYWCNATFSTMHMVMCIDHICMQGSLEPLKLFWNSLLFARNPRSSIIVQEFTKAIVVLMYACVNKKKYLQSEEIIFRNSLEVKDLDSLSLEEMLTILDLLVKEVPDFLEKIEINNTNLSWNDWFKKYWLVAPLTGVFVGMKIYLSYLATQAAMRAQETIP